MGLDEFLERYRDRQYQPGTHDCALFAADWIEEVTGRDLAADMRGQYETVEEGFTLLSSGLQEALSAELTELSGWMAAAPGDVALVDIDGEDACGIIGRGGIHMLSERGGLTRLRLDRARKVFRP